MHEVLSLDLQKLGKMYECIITFLKTFGVMAHYHDKFHVHYIVQFHRHSALPDIYNVTFSMIMMDLNQMLPFYASIFALFPYAI